ncbi:MAG: hypothetical protein L6R42_005229 [Xanthoria sp. 1 TBL-2021]|nr:MAG: hypothetical protein L6R42_005229 [Xanthoria sp. 1 TBL-2021]
MAGQRPEAMSLARSGNESDETEEHKYDTTTFARTFNPRTQFSEICRAQFWRLLFTAVLVALVIVTLTIYDLRKAVAHADKITFNTIITVLDLALGLNFFVWTSRILGSIITVWRVLANRKFTARETELIIGGESLIKLLTLMRESMKKPLTCFVCACWLALDLVTCQASVAMRGLTYPMDTGVDSKTITTSRGMVSVQQVGCYYKRGTCTTDPDQPPEIAQNEAQAYGELTQGLESCPYATDEDIFDASQDCQYFYSNRSQEFAYRSAEYNPQDRRRPYPYQTKHLIKVSPGPCYQSSPKGDDVYYAPSNDGPASKVVLRFSSRTDDELVSAARSDTAYDSRTYAYTGDRAPQNASTVACGPRCIWVNAIRWNGTVTNRGTDVFKSPISVSNVTNVGDPAHVVLDNTARMAAASIAL